MVTGRRPDDAFVWPVARGELMGRQVVEHRVRGAVRLKAFVSHGRQGVGHYLEGGQVRPFEQAFGWSGELQTRGLNGFGSGGFIHGDSFTANGRNG